jgi:hypothetical protein
MDIMDVIVRKRRRKKKSGLYHFTLLSKDFHQERLKMLKIFLNKNNGTLGRK